MWSFECQNGSTSNFFFQHSSNEIKFFFVFAVITQITNYIFSPPTRSTLTFIAWILGWLLCKLVWVWKESFFREFLEGFNCEMQHPSPIAISFSSLPSSCCFPLQNSSPYVQGIYCWTFIEIFLRFFSSFFKSITLVKVARASNILFCYCIPFQFHFKKEFPLLHRFILWSRSLSTGKWAWIKLLDHEWS